MSANLKQYLPWYYEESREMTEITNAEDYVLDHFFTEELMLLKDNQFILTANESTIYSFEKMLEIAPDPATEPLEFRRERLINRLAMRAPFTMRFLRGRLDMLIGKNAYDVYVDYPSYTLTIESSAADQNWNHEIRVMINRVKPANMIYRNIPLVHESVKMHEVIQMSQYVWNYRAGTSARTSTTRPIANYGSSNEVLGAGNLTIQTSLLEKIANFTAGEIEHVLINDVYEIHDFMLKQGNTNIVNIEYSIPQAAGIAAVTNIKLRDAAGNNLTNSPVYFNVQENVIVKHVIPVKEGV